MIAGLPYDAEVEYLESTGTQWIDTGYTPSGPTTFNLSATFTPTSSEFDFFGAYRLYTQGSMICGCYNKFVFGYNPPNSRIDSASLGSAEIYAKIEYSLGQSSRTLKVNGTTYSGNGATFSNLEVTLFRSNFIGIFKCHAFQIYDANGILVRDFQPVRFTNENGQSEGAMYDRVSRKLFRNAGTGSFTIGPDVATPVMGLHFMKLPKKTAKNYVQDGLIAMWDGIENAGWGVHDAAATTWKDLIGNRDLTLASASFTTNSLHRGTSVAGYMAYDSGERLTISGTGVGLTVEICARLEYNTIGIPISVPVSINGVGHNTGFKTRMTASGYDQYGVGPVAGNSMVYRPPWPRNGIYGTITYRLDLASFYNAIAMVPDSSLSFPPGNVHGTGIALGSNSAYNVFGDIYAARVYSRALTGAEIEANYAVDKERFNLP